MKHCYAVIRKRSERLVGVGDRNRTRAKNERRGTREYSSSAMLRRIAVTCRTGAPYSFATS